MIERRTLIRRRADSFRADVLRGERSPMLGAVEEEDRCESSRRMDYGEEDWQSLRCDLPFGHLGNHIHDDYEWDLSDD